MRAQVGGPPDDWAKYEVLLNGRKIPNVTMADQEEGILDVAVPLPSLGCVAQVRHSGKVELVRKHGV